MTILARIAQMGLATVRLFIKQPKGMREVTNFPTHVTKVP
jgi:hypothetical protein